MSGPICDKCGKVHLTVYGTQACTGHISSGEEQGRACTNPPRRGGYVCRYHGGNIGVVQRAAETRLKLMEAQGEIAALMAQCDLPDQDPAMGLLEVVRVSGAMMRLLTVKVGELSEDPEVHEVLVESKTGELSTKKVSGLDGFWGYTKDGEMTPHPYVQLLKVWNERYEKACSVALSSGIAERQVRLAEQQAELVGLVVKGILSKLNLTPAQWELAPTVVREQMQLLSA